jgi:hypothetical protein
MNESMGIGWFAELLAPRFVERDGVVVLSPDSDCAARNRQAFDTLSDLEAGCTHVHVLDHFQNDAELREPMVGADGYELYYDLAHPDFHAACAIGLGMVHAWAAHLKALFTEARLSGLLHRIGQPHRTVSPSPQRRVALVERRRSPLARSRRTCRRSRYVRWPTD